MKNGQVDGVYVTGTSARDAVEFVDSYRDAIAFSTFTAEEIADDKASGVNKLLAD